MIARLAAILALALLALLAAGFREQPSTRVIDRYDHISTGFVLDGRHVEVACDTCHVRAQFKGTPRTCAACHNNVRAEGKTFRHIPTPDRCESCHTTKDWLTSRFDHSGVVTNCVRCHNNFLAPGKTPDHPQTSNICVDCHRSTHWNQLLPGARGSGR
jgi:hypothetical protein